jgi:hypothetical protein
MKLPSVSVTPESQLVTCKGMSGEWIGTILANISTNLLCVSKPVDEKHLRIGNEESACCFLIASSRLVYPREGRTRNYRARYKAHGAGRSVSCHWDLSCRIHSLMFLFSDPDIFCFHTRDTTRSEKEAIDTSRSGTEDRTESVC